jgi:uncharacterized coiled-coil protein SlyX
VKTLRLANEEIQTTQQRLAQLQTQVDLLVHRLRKAENRIELLTNHLRDKRG